ncbi:hypothetical protein HanIR_Chr09g0449131 [Helianthus annuus]|nr:hypothetical protein HanIR_Chr09g0449131 [Helianthus annuus]
MNFTLNKLSVFAYQVPNGKIFPRHHVIPFPKLQTRAKVTRSIAQIYNSFIFFVLESGLNSFYDFTLFNKNKGLDKQK